MAAAFAPWRPLPMPPHSFCGAVGRAVCQPSASQVPPPSALPATACPTLGQKQRDVGADGLGARSGVTRKIGTKSVAEAGSWKNAAGGTWGLWSWKKGCGTRGETLRRSEDVTVTQSCPTLRPWTVCSPPGSSVRGILQARILEWVAIHFSWGSSQSRAQIWVCHIAGRFLYCLRSQGGPHIR